MIETALVFALGALSSGILALLLFPAFTRRAARLARRDVEARLPRSLDEIAALRDGVRAEFAARTARVQSVLDATARALTDERLTKAEMSVELAALRTERRDLRSAIADVEARLEAAYTVLREREEALAQASADKRDLDRRLRDTEDRARRTDDRLLEAERLTGEARMALAAAETRAAAVEEVARSAGILLPPRTGGPLYDLPPLYIPPVDAPPRAAADGGIGRTTTISDPAKPLTLSPEIAAAVADRLRIARRIAQASASRTPPADTIPAIPHVAPGPVSAAPAGDQPSLPVAGAWMVAASTAGGAEGESDEPVGRPDEAWRGGALAPSTDAAPAPAIPPEVIRLLRQAHGVDPIALQRPVEEPRRIALPVATAWSLEHRDDLSIEAEPTAGDAGPVDPETGSDHGRPPRQPVPKARAGSPGGRRLGKPRVDDAAGGEAADDPIVDEEAPAPPARQLQPIPVVNRSGGPVSERPDPTPATTSLSGAPFAPTLAPAVRTFGHDEHRNRLVDDLAARLRTFGAAPPDEPERSREMTTASTESVASEHQTGPEPDARPAKNPRG